MSEHLHHARPDPIERRGTQASNLANDDRVARREQLARPRVADAVQRSTRKVSRHELDGGRVAVRVARHLAEHEVATTRIRQHDRRSELRA